MNMEKKQYVHPSMAVKTMEDPLLSSFSTNTSGATEENSGAEGGAKLNNQSFTKENGDDAEQPKSVW